MKKLAFVLALAFATPSSAQTFTFKDLTTQDVSALSKALADQPYKDVAPLIAKMQQQFQQQVQEQQPKQTPKTDEPK